MVVCGKSQNLTQRIDYVLQFCGLRKISQVKSPDDALLDVFALCRGVTGHKNGIWGDRTPESLRLQSDDL